MIEKIDFNIPVESLQAQLPNFESGYYVPVELASWVLEMYLPGIAFDLQATETQLRITLPDQEISLSFDPELHESYHKYATIEKLNAILQKYEVEERIYGLYFNANPVFYYFICTPAEAGSVFSQFEQNKKIRIADPDNYYKAVFVLPQADNYREVVVYNVSSLPFTNEELNFLNTAGCPLELLLYVAYYIGKSHTTLKVLRKYNDSNEQLDEYVNGIIFRGAVSSLETDAAYQARANGYYLFGAAMQPEYINETKEVEPESFLIKLNDQFEVLSYRGTNGMNYNVTTSAIIDNLKKWDQKYGLTIKGVDYDWVDFKLHSVPEDLDDFAKELYAFCPDCIDQGVGSNDMLKRVIRTEKYVCLWWD